MFHLTSQLYIYTTCMHIELYYKELFNCHLCVVLMTESDEYVCTYISIIINY